MIKEACVESFEKALEAQNHGANRIELCENLIVGGTTLVLTQMVYCKLFSRSHIGC